MKSNLLAKTFCEQIEAFFGQGRCFLFAKGRVGLYAGLRAMGLPRGSKILMPGYTCMVVPSAVQYAGLTPAYVDIDPETYNLNPALLDSAAPPDIAAIIVQHTYGIPCDMTALGAWAKTKNVPVIEDGCHAFGSCWRGRLCGTFGVFAFMSGQWNKPFSTGLGGLLLVNDPVLADRVAQIIRDEAFVPRAWENLLLRVQILAHQLLVRPSTAMMTTSLYRVLGRLGLVIGSSSAGELRVEMPRRYLGVMAPCQARQGLKEMARIEENIRHRRRLTAFYQVELPRLGFTTIPLPVVDELPLLRYPVRVSNKEEVLSRASRAGVEIGSWFEVPLHPAETNMESLGYRQGMCPEAEAASREVVNLPTHLKVDRRTAEKTLEFLARCAQPA
jgi:dTDP-4-amino-4,6-dideoxygalactose transaminase